MELAVHHITTQKQWSDIVLNPSTMDQLEQLRSWLKQCRENTPAKSKLQLSYRALFYGPPGTGKCLTAAILANELGTEIYHVDLSHLVSKYIGETEKNLNLLFNRAEEKGWILFFDEADALFGSRTDVKDAHDKYANQEISYLLQCIEKFQGLVILASNMKNNIDDAFIRRFQSIIHFPLPTAAERRRLWAAGFSDSKLLLEKLDIDTIAEQYELSPAAIMNVVHYVEDTQKASAVTNELVTAGIKQELARRKTD